MSNSNDPSVSNVIDQRNIIRTDCQILDLLVNIICYVSLSLKEAPWIYWTNYAIKNNLKKIWEISEACRIYPLLWTVSILPHKPYAR